MCLLFSCRCQRDSHQQGLAACLGSGSQGMAYLSSLFQSLLLRNQLRQHCADSHLGTCRLPLLYLWPCSTPFMQPIPTCMATHSCVKICSCLLYLWPCSTSFMQPILHARQHTAVSKFARACCTCGHAAHHLCNPFNMHGNTQLCQDLLVPAVPVAMQHIIYATHSTCMALQTPVSRFAVEKVLQHMWMMKPPCLSLPHFGASAIW